METKTYKRLPYGNSDFKSIITENYAYVDKTRYIEMLEKESNKSHFFIRPRKFGKSLFFMTLWYYYNLNEAENFDQLFGNLYIGKHPTPERNSYALLRLDFSGLDTSSEEGFKIAFSSCVQSAVCNFLCIYSHIFPGADKYVDQIEQENQGIRSLEKIFYVAEQNRVKLFFIIDEYDHFANDLIAMGNRQGKDFYKTMVAANGLVRDFYERIKIAAKSSIVNRTFITGISPVMLDDLTSGYNIAQILTLNPRYNEMMGFTQEEVEWLMKETGVDESCINIDMQAYYNGYLFHQDGENRVYNPAMILYFLGQILEFRKPPEDIVDLNLKTDYGRLRRLIQNDSNRATLIRIMKEGEIVAEVLKKFSVDRLNDERYFISLLFYMGLLTIKKPYLFQLKLGIPNYSIQTLYWEYIMLLVEETSPDLNIEARPLNEAIYALAMDGNLEQLIAYISENAFSKLSDYDLRRFDEKYIQILLLAYLFISKVYVPMSEYETVPGRADIYLQRSPRLPQIKYEWVLELKYCKTNASETEIADQQKKGQKQVEQYLASHRLGNRPDLKAAVIVFTGKDKYRITAIQ
ncbi:MAG: ATP-binding protein [Dysgonamonadaceae bacterium]|nr:ATP-binding protein [Dysgonamonadaceae bacterium]